jgi:hypothetical protein
MFSCSGLIRLIVNVSTSHALRHTTLGRTPLDEGLARHRDLYLITHNTHKGQLCPPAGFEPSVPRSKRPQTYALDRAATGIGNCVLAKCIFRFRRRKHRVSVTT